MEFIWVAFAFVCGLGVKMVAMPPLIGFLAAGFVLHFMGLQPTENLETLADLGITLMLFTIGLKLNVKDLLKREVWAGTLAHMAIWNLVIAAGLVFLAVLAVPYFTELSWQAAALLAFALSFSSTVCIVKLLEESGEMKTRHGQLIISVLVMQDIAAVLFLVLATGKIPSLWALGLIALYWVRPLMDQLLVKAGHGELLPLTGFFLALGGYELFDAVGVKGDLGALIFGMLLASSTKASELNKSLMAFKDIFLIGFFLSIGFTALPDWSMISVGALLVVLIPVKFLLFFLVFTRLRLRGRTSYLSALALSNFSEFGLIVAALCVDANWLSREWLVIIALAVSFSFVVTSLLYRSAHTIYMRRKDQICTFEMENRLPEDYFVQPYNAEMLVVGLGRVGKGAFKALYNMHGDKVWGMDADRKRISRLQEKGLHVFFGDGEDADHWEQLDLSKIELIMLALPSIDDMINVSVQLRNANYQGELAAIARYQDELKPLHKAGIDHVYNFFTEAGTSFAEDSLSVIEKAREKRGVPLRGS